MRRSEQHADHACAVKARAVDVVIRPCYAAEVAAPPAAAVQVFESSCGEYVNKKNMLNETKSKSITMHT